MVIKNILGRTLISFVCFAQLLHADIPADLIARIERASSLQEAVGLPPHAEQAAVTKAYRSLMLTIHPDKNIEQADVANELSKKITTLHSYFADGAAPAHSKRARTAASYEADYYSQASTVELFSAAELLLEIFKGDRSEYLNLAIRCRQALPAWQRDEGATALQYAIAHDNCPAVMSILQSGIKIDNETFVPNPLFFALKKSKKLANHHLLINLMLRRGANPCAISDMDYYLEHDNFALSPDEREHAVHGLTPLHYAARTSNGLVVAEMLAAIKQQGRTLPGIDSDRRTPLHYAAIKGDYDSVWSLLQEGYKPMVNQPDIYGKSPLNYAVEAKHALCTGLMAVEDVEL